MPKKLNFGRVKRPATTKPPDQPNNMDSSLENPEVSDTPDAAAAAILSRRKRSSKKLKEMPTTTELESELKRVRHSKLYKSTFKSTVYSLVIVAAFAVLVATLWLPVLRIYGTSMAPTLNEGDLILSVKQSDFQVGDVVAFYYNNKILVKRVIAGPGDYVDIDDDGNVSVNGSILDEPYLTEKARGETDLSYPYQVPDMRYFVMGDHRSISLDSRTRAIGSIAEEQIVGKLAFKIWPLNQ